MAKVKTYTLTLDAQELHDLIEAVLLVLLILCTSCSPRQYTSDDLAEAKAESYQEGYRNGYDDALDEFAVDSH